jgi:hypothetical protein
LIVFDAGKLGLIPYRKLFTAEALRKIFKKIYFRAQPPFAASLLLPNLQASSYPANTFCAHESKRKLQEKEFCSGDNAGSLRLWQTGAGSAAAAQPVTNSRLGRFRVAIG